jgi:hypothetical protein
MPRWCGVRPSALDNSNLSVGSSWETTSELMKELQSRWNQSADADVGFALGRESGDILVCCSCVDDC